jgi:hypothetical protein
MGYEPERGNKLMPQSSSAAQKTNQAQVIAAIECRDWAALDRLVGMSAAEAERILREEPMIDAADFNRRLEELDRQECPNVAQGFDVPTARGESPGASTPSA